MSRRRKTTPTLTANVAMPAEVLEIVDARAESLGVTRSAYILCLLLADLETGRPTLEMRAWQEVVRRARRRKQKP